MEDLWEILAMVLLAALAILIITALAFYLFAPHEFEGYYLSGGRIWASYKWAPDEGACDYTAERWQQIIDEDLHRKPKAK